MTQAIENQGPGPTARDRRARVAVAAAYAVQGLSFAGVLTKVPAIQSRFDLSEIQLSLILLAVPLVAGVGSVLAGVLAPRVGSALVLRVAGIGVCVLVAGIGLAHVLAALLVAVCLFGLFVGGVDATMNMQGVAVQHRYGRSVLASFHGWWSLAGIAGSLANAGAAWLDLSLDLSLIIIAVVGAVVALAAGPRLVSHAEEGTPHAEPDADVQPDLLPAQPAEPAATGPAGPATKVGWGVVLLIGLAVMIMYIGESSVSNWAAVFLQTVLTAGDTLVPLGLAAYLACQLAGRAMADRAVRRFGAAPTMAVGGLIGVCGFAVVVAAGTAIVAIAGFGVVGVGLCVVVPLAFSAAGALDPTGSAGVIARVNLFNYLGFVVGTALIGVIAESISLRWAFAVPGVLALGIVALAPVFRAAGGGVVGRGARTRDLNTPA